MPVDRKEAPTRKQGVRFGRATFIVLWAVAFVAFIIGTNVGFLQRVELLIDQDRLVTLVIFVALWGVCIGALVVAALQTNLSSRVFWAVVIAVATAAGVSFRLISGNEIGLLDIISLWNVRHEASRAGGFYAEQIHVGLGVLAIALVLFLFAPRTRSPSARLWLRRMAWVPIVPVILIAAIVYLKEGGGSHALPVQFQPLSVAGVSGAVLATSGNTDRQPIGVVPGERLARNVVLLVDESVRGDYIDWTPGNPYTPELASLQARLADFGPALSGGTCSHYANAILRFTTAPQDLGNDVLKRPTIWQYAKNAGYRTVFIDAQSAFNKNADKFQNFMTSEETKNVDRVYFLPEDTPPSELDFLLLDIVRHELASAEPVFIYANKNGAHFPYDYDYPESAKRFVPTMGDSATDTAEARINSYRNAVKWSVDGFFKHFFDDIKLDDTVMIYTSDHGQAFDPRALTHCSVDDPNPREAVVPLFVATDDEALAARFAGVAARSEGGESHFSIAPTLLELFGYDLAGMDRRFPSSLLNGGEVPDFFTTGDIFGLFSDTRRHVADPTMPRLEQNAPGLATSALR
jgi:lipid A ethanolaminephosphotransferase